VKKIKQHYPRRGKMLNTAFEPLTDDAFRQFVASGDAVPARQGAALIVTKWRDGPGLGADAFLESLRAEGSTLEFRKFNSDVNIRVVRSAKPSTGTEKVTRVRKARS
jgi:hypothetical protein